LGTDGHWKIARFTAKADKRDEVLAAVRQFVSYLGPNEPGTLRCEAFVEKDRNGFVQLMEFEDDSAEEAHLQSAHAKAFLDVLGPLCEEPPVFVEALPAGSMDGEALPVRNLRQRLDLLSSCEEVFESLMDSAKHRALTGLSAELSRSIGGRFTTCGGRSYGTHIEIVPGRRIIQAWAHRNWPEQQYSVVMFDLQPRTGGCTLLFTQVGIPASFHTATVAMWQETYWEPLRSLSLR